MSETKVRSLRSQSLDLLRFPLAVIVVTVHMVTIQGVSTDMGNLDVQSNEAFLVFHRFVTAFLQGISVPIYFFISGYVFFANMPEMTKERYFQKLRNRTKTLLIPYLVWNALELLLVIVKSIPALGAFSSVPGVAPDLSFGSVLACFWRYDGELFPNVHGGGGEALYPLVYSLWFLRDLMIVVVFSPVLHWAIRKFRWGVLVVLFMIYLLIPDNNRFHFLITALLFFSTGAYLSIWQIDMFRAFRPFSRWALVLYPLLCLFLFFVLGSPKVMHYAKVLSIIVALPLAYNMAAWLLQNTRIKVSSFLASASFFIYVSHLLICFRVLKLFVIMLQPEQGWAVVATYVVSEVAVILLLLGMFYLMKRYTPSLLRVVAGRK